MTFDEYQAWSLTTAHVADQHKGTIIENTIWAMGIAGEAGEVLEKWKKIVAYKEGEISDEDLAELKKELGDVVWYIAVMAHGLGLSLEEVMQVNVDKQNSRKQRGVIKGAGDNR